MAHSIFPQWEAWMTGSPTNIENDRTDSIAVLEFSISHLSVIDFSPNN
ncbi:hypothetical protein [Neobacillus niacini]|nr:hypothetical protein [Neobacillus niacini]